MGYKQLKLEFSPSGGGGASVGDLMGELTEKVEWASFKFGMDTFRGAMDVLMGELTEKVEVLSARVEELEQELYGDG